MLRHLTEQFTLNPKNDDADGVQKAKFGCIECFLMFFDNFKYKGPIVVTSNNKALNNGWKLLANAEVISDE